MDHLTTWAIANGACQRARGEGYEAELRRRANGAWEVRIFELCETPLARGSILVRADGRVSADAGVPARVWRLFSGEAKAA
jgi:hypothetical protein